MVDKQSLIKYMKMLLPAVLVAFLVIDAIYAYKFPDLSKYKAEVPQTAAAAVKKPSLKMRDQKKKHKKGPAGTAAPLKRLDESMAYRDGKYTGSARGFGGMITVEVTVQNEKISKVSILSAPGEDAAYFNKAKKLTGIITKNNTTNVDAVSGATYSSNGIINAVRSALSKAAVKKSKKAAAAKTKRQKKNKTVKTTPPGKDAVKKPAAVTEGDWRDGTYTGKGDGFGGKLYVTVVIKDGKIHSIAIGENKEDKEYLAKAKDTLISSIIKSQGTEVDTVSGATYSSVGIIEAVNDALKKAQIKKEKSDSNRGSQNENKISAEPGADAADPAASQQPAVTVEKTVKVYCDEDEDFEEYDLKIVFQIREGKIISIQSAEQVIPERSNDAYIRAALMGIRAQIRTKPDFQQLDTVSGATCTSRSMIEGGQLALREAR